MAASPVMQALFLIRKGAVAVNLGGVFNGEDTATVGGSKGRHFLTRGSVKGIGHPMQAISLDDGRWKRSRRPVAPRSWKKRLVTCMRIEKRALRSEK